MKLHEGEVDIDGDLVGRLVATQFPRFADLPLTGLRSTGTVNAIYRLGDHHCVRLPRLRKWAPDLEKELYWLPRLASSVSLRVPEPIGTGRPAEGYPFTWAIYRWVEGSPYRDDLIDDESRAAEDLARFVLELRRVETRGAPRGGRRPLGELDGATRAAIASSRNDVDADAAAAAWDRALRSPAWSGPATWIHTDLLRPNVLVDGGAISAVIDFGGAGVGDPAADLIAAWSIFGPRSSALSPRARRRRGRLGASARLRAPPGRADHSLLSGDESGVRGAGKADDRPGPCRRRVLIVGGRSSPERA